MKFTQEHEMFRQMVRRFVEEEINPHVDEWEEAGIFPAHDALQEDGRPRLARPDLSRRIRRAGAGLLVHSRPLRGAGQGQLLRRPDGHHRAYRHVYARAGAASAPTS